MQHFTRLAEGIDTNPLLSELAAEPELWLSLIHI